MKVTKAIEAYMLSKILILDEIKKGIKDIHIKNEVPKNGCMFNDNSNLNLDKDNTSNYHFYNEDYDYKNALILHYILERIEYNEKFKLLSFIMPHANYPLWENCLEDGGIMIINKIAPIPTTFNHILVLAFKSWDKYKEFKESIILED